MANTKFELKNRYTHINYKEVESQEKLNCKNYTLEEQAIINIIKNNPSVNQEEIARLINKSLRTVKARMIEMQDKEKIARENGKRNGKWIILQ